MNYIKFTQGLFYVREYRLAILRDSSIQTRVLSYIPPIAHLYLITFQENLVLLGLAER
jgi:hypothetical protein